MNVPVSGSSLYLIIPGPAAGGVKQQALKAMVFANRPAPLGCEARKRLPGQMKPSSLELRTLVVRNRSAALTIGFLRTGSAWLAL